MLGSGFGAARVGVARYARVARKSVLDENILNNVEVVLIGCSSMSDCGGELKVKMDGYMGV